MKHCIVVLRDNDGWVIGPFDTHEASCLWAERYWDGNRNDPRWQVVALPANLIVGGKRPIVALPLHAPENATGLI